MTRFTVLFVFAVTSCLSAADEWKAGAVSTIITPEQPMWMAGYGSRDTPATGKRTELHAKALVLEAADGNRGLILSLDLVGIDRGFAASLSEQLHEKHGFSREQIAICTSHTHSGPVVGKNLGPLHYWVVDAEQQKLIDDYAVALEEKLVDLAGQAIADLAPARIQAGSGKCSFAVNRRENKPYSDVTNWRSRGQLKGPVDHDVPVLSVRDPEGALRAVLFGYACHSTVLQTSVWDGDYPGYAMARLEQDHPGAIALFWAGCGGDQNPLPRREVSLAEQYGADLADRVTDVLRAPMPELAPTLETAFREIDAPLQSPPTRQQLEEATESTNRFEVAWAESLLREVEEKGAIDDHYPFPIGVWSIGGEIDFVVLGGEVVIDYALRLKRERKGTSTWVAGNANDVMAYLPSLRVLREGGYEGGGANIYYGLPSLWSEEIEEVIVEAVHETK